MRIGGRNAVSEFVQPCLAYRDSARGIELFNNTRVVIGHEISVNLRTSGRPYALSEDQIFVGDRNAVQRSAVRALREFGIHIRRPLLSHIAGNGDKGVQLWVELVDAVQALARQFEGRNLAGAKGRSGLLDRHSSISATNGVAMSSSGCKVSVSGWNNFSRPSSVGRIVSICA